MIVDAAEFLTIDFPAMLAGTLSCVACALVGNFLVLRRQALIGDAISHVVLPGIVLAFLVTGGLAAGPVMAGALLAALVAILLIEGVKRLGGLESGAAMGVVFTTMFAGGVVLLEMSPTSGAHLDTQHALYGSLEATLWIGPTGWSSRQVVTLAVVCGAIAALIVLFFKELGIATFDPALAEALGLRPRWIGLGLSLAVGAAAVASFEAVGSILVIAMFVCPPCTARMLTDRLSRQIWLSVAAAVLSGVFGYGAAVVLPGAVGLDALNAAGMIAVVAGLLQVTAMLAAPRYGVVGRVLARWRASADLSVSRSSPK
jgi:manganese/zinc/iron transport system permease protein